MAITTCNSCPFYGSSVCVKECGGFVEEQGEINE